MSTNPHIRHLRYLPLLLLCMAFGSAVVLFWMVDRTPLPLPLIYVDTLASFMLVVLCVSLVLAWLATTPNWPRSEGLHAAALLVLAALACLCALPIVAALLLLIIAVFTVAAHIRRPAVALPLLLAALAALVAALGLTLRGVLRYDDPAAGAALDSLVFWFTLLAAAIPALPLINADEPPSEPFGGLARILFFYPLARLFTLGPWNEGWSLATMLLGGGIVCWAALATLTRPGAAARALAAQRFWLGLALGALGLASSAGVAAWCYALFTYGLLCCLPTQSNMPRWVGWARTGALPLTAPFMACWLAIGAAAATGATALAAILWLASLLRSVALLLEQPDQTYTRTGLVVGSASVAMGVLAPPIAAYLLQPVVDQLQGGLTPYGNLSIAPWVGLALLDSGSRTVTTAPTLAAAGLMLVLVALVFLLARLWPRQLPLTDVPEPLDGPDRSTLIADLISMVPWLGAANSKKARDHDAR